jgi:type I restriction enzyme M protein
MREPKKIPNDVETPSKPKKPKQSRTKDKSTEVDAYIFIKENLRTLGWDTRNPGRNQEGRVYTQNECLSHPEIQTFLGQERPENIVKITESKFWVIEAKKEHRQLQQALNEAKEYAIKINYSKNIKVKLISGVAGNHDDTYLIKTMFFDGVNYVPITINTREISGLLSPTQVKLILDNDNPNIADIQIDTKLFVSKAEEINEILHLGAVNPHQRASVMAALLLSMLDDPPNIDEAPSLLINAINARVNRLLKNQKKEEFYDYIKLNLPATEDNHFKFKGAIVATLQELNNLNIRSAMNSGVDVLGTFYEVFLKYANWAQDLGIVLTPRHITQFAVEAVNVRLQDIVYDPTSGTGGFLVASFDYVKRNSNEEQLGKFKRNSLFGVEQDDSIASLAIVNMIFRGDGKNNIVQGNCFARFLAPTTAYDGTATAQFTNVQSNNPPVTKVLMNPPFALKRSSEKEYKFIDYALKQMQDGGILFSILPSSVMIKGGSALDWRKKLLQNNTLVSVITFPPDLFYPIGITAIGVFIKKGIQHPKEQNVFWIRALNDGLLKKKGKRLQNPRATNDLEKVKHYLKAFIGDPIIPIENIPESQIAAPINFSDPDLELVPEVYLEAKIPETKEIEDGMEKLIRESVAYLIKAGKEGIVS